MERLKVINATIQKAFNVSQAKEQKVVEACKFIFSVKILDFALNDQFELFGVSQIPEYKSFMIDTDTRRKEKR